MVMEKRATGHPSHFIAHNPKCLLLTLSNVGLKVASIDIAHKEIAEGSEGEAAHVENVTESAKPT